MQDFLFYYFLFLCFKYFSNNRSLLNSYVFLFVCNHKTNSKKKNGIQKKKEEQRLYHAEKRKEPYTREIE